MDEEAILGGLRSSEDLPDYDYEEFETGSAGQDRRGDDAGRDTNRSRGRYTDNGDDRIFRQATDDEQGRGARSGRSGSESGFGQGHLDFISMAMNMARPHTDDQEALPNRQAVVRRELVYYRNMSDACMRRLGATENSIRTLNKMNTRVMSQFADLEGSIEDAAGLVQLAHDHPRGRGGRPNGGYHAFAGQGHRIRSATPTPGDGNARDSVPPNRPGGGVSLTDHVLPNAPGRVDVALVRLGAQFLPLGIGRIAGAEELCRCRTGRTLHRGGRALHRGGRGKNHWPPRNDRNNRVGDNAPSPGGSRGTPGAPPDRRQAAGPTASGEPGGNGPDLSRMCARDNPYRREHPCASFVCVTCERDFCELCRGDDGDCCNCQFLKMKCWACRRNALEVSMYSCHDCDKNICNEHTYRGEDCFERCSLSCGA